MGCGDQRRHHLPALPGAAELRLAQDCSELDPFPPLAFLYDGIRPAHISWFPTVSRLDRARVDPADVRRQEYDVCGRPTPRPVLDRSLFVPRPHVPPKRSMNRCSMSKIRILRT